MTDEFEELVSRIEKAEKRKWLLDAARFHLSEAQRYEKYASQHRNVAEKYIEEVSDL